MARLFRQLILATSDAIIMAGFGMGLCFRTNSEVKAFLDFIRTLRAEIGKKDAPVR